MKVVLVLRSSSQPATFGSEVKGLKSFPVVFTVDDKIKE
jgi:hypothetical protein